MSYLDTFSLQGKVALVPGGGGAIGSAISKALAGAGAQVVVVNQTQEKADATASAIVAAGGEAIGVAADATSEADADRAVAAALDRFGRVDIVVNAIGGGAGKVLHDAQAYPRDAWDWIMELNVRSTIIPTQAAVRAMIEAGNGGRVVNLSSVRAVLGHQRRLLRVRRREGRDRVPHPPVGHRVGEATASTSTPSARRSSTRRRWRRSSATRRSRQASSAGSRSGASAAPTTSRAPSSSSPPPPPRSSPAR